jgi:hypothetical protein
LSLHDFLYYKQYSYFLNLSNLFLFLAISSFKKLDHTDDQFAFMCLCNSFLEFRTTFSISVFLLFLIISANSFLFILLIRVLDIKEESHYLWWKVSNVGFLYSPIICSITFRSLYLVSISKNTTCCQVPSIKLPFVNGTVRLGPIKDART